MSFPRAGPSRLIRALHTTAVRAAPPRRFGLKPRDTDAEHDSHAHSRSSFPSRDGYRDRESPRQSSSSFPSRDGYRDRESPRQSSSPFPPRGGYRDRESPRSSGRAYGLKEGVRPTPRNDRDRGRDSFERTDGRNSFQRMDQREPPREIRVKPKKPKKDPHRIGGWTLKRKLKADKLAAEEAARLAAERGEPVPDPDAPKPFVPPGKTMVRGPGGEMRWKPTKKLTFAAMAGLRELHAQDPERFTRAQLGEQFGISREAVKRILRSTFRDQQGAAKAGNVTGALGKWDRNPSSGENAGPVPAIRRVYALKKEIEGADGSK